MKKRLTAVLGQSGNYIISCMAKKISLSGSRSDMYRGADAGGRGGAMC